MDTRRIFDNLNNTSMRSFLLLALVLFTGTIYAQKVYRTSGGELIFSRPVNNSPFPGSTSKTRFSAFLHYNNNFHYNYSKFSGVYTGVSVSNIGFIYQITDTTFKKRAYTLGFPLALKFGNLNKDNFIFLGGELEFPFHYKQKKKVDDQKNKYSAFFDKRVNNVLPSLFAGIQFSSGYCFKIRMYLNDFLNKNFDGTDFGTKIQYKNTDTKLFLISLSYNLKQNKIKKIIKNEGRYADLQI